MFKHRWLSDTLHTVIPFFLYSFFNIWCRLPNEQLIQYIQIKDDDSQEFSLYMEITLREKHWIKFWRQSIALLHSVTLHFLKKQVQLNICHYCVYCVLHKDNKWSMQGLHIIPSYDESRQHCSTWHIVQITRSQHEESAL